MDLEKLKIPELKQLLGKMNLPKSGKKAELISRIKANRQKQVKFENIQPKVDEKLWIPTNNRDFLHFIESEFSEYKLKSVDPNKDLCNAMPAIKQLFEYQKFLTEYMRLHNKVGNEKAGSRGLLVYWGLGSGKTIGAINIVEACRIYGNQVRKVIAMIPATLHDEPWVKELKGPLGPKTISSEKDLPKNGWNLLHYNDTTGFKKRLASFGPNPFDNAVVVIDEVHNFFNTLPRKNEGDRWNLYKQMLTAKNAKFIFISGTPVMNTPFELAFIYNILRGGKLFPEEEEEFMNLFFRDGKMINKKMFMRRINGLTSYYSGAEESVFAQKKIKRVNLEMTDIQTTNMIKIQEFEEKLMSSKDNTPLGQSRSDVESQIKTMKRAIALNARGALADALAIRSSPFQNERDEKTRLFTFSRANANISYPQEILGKFSKKNVDAIVDPKHFKNVVENLNFSNMKQYSPKFVSAISLINKSTGPVLLYSSFKEVYGINMFASTLKHVGWEEFGKGTSNKPKFVLWTGDTKQSDKNIILKNFNSNKNVDGSVIKAILITEAGREGINLRSVRQVHILEPWWNLNRVKQVIGRAVRICSHAHLPKKDQVVDVYQYFVDYPSGMRTKMPAPDILVELVAKKKNRMESEILMAVKSSAIDCRLNKSHNKEVKDCVDYSGFTQQVLFNMDITKDQQDMEDIESFRRIEYKGTTYIMVRNNVYENKTADEMRKGIQPKLIGHAEIDLQGNIVNIIKQDIDSFVPVVIKGRKLLKKGEYIYSFLSTLDLEKGLKPIRLFKEN
jgi:superfamily II DNA or RNA helicase